MVVATKNIRPVVEDKGTPMRLNWNEVPQQKNNVENGVMHGYRMTADMPTRKSVTSKSTYLSILVRMVSCEFYTE